MRAVGVVEIAAGILVAIIPRYAAYVVMAWLWLIIVNLVLFVVAMFTSGNISPGEREDRANRWVLPAFAIIAFKIAATALVRASICWRTFSGATCSYPAGG